MPPALPGASRTTLDDLLLASLSALAAAGEVEQACRLAGQACALHRSSDARAWNRFNSLLHRLSRQTE
ncbi:MAG: hypothetical protein AMXMBFR45_20350 [Gammaproteobacteria bacterium]|nr:MAG: hypothetical protein BroJett010_15470 [Gammaproteobacteria bacterium]